MDFHPKNLPILKTYDLKNEKEATDAVEDMVDLGFENRKEGFKVGVTHGLRQKNETRDIKYWTYHHDKDHYAIVLISNTTLAELGF